MNNRSSVVAIASNIKPGSENPLTLSEFFEVYPQFLRDDIPQAVSQMMLDEANSVISENRWHSQWKIAVCLYTAHRLTMWAKTVADTDVPIENLVHKGDSNGTMSSKSVGGVSVSYGGTSADSDLSGYGSLRDTIYGQQLASMARLIGKGMMVIR